MFSVELHSGPRIDVAYRKHTLSYAVDGSLPNPMEAFYGTLAGCAGVYAKKACQRLGISDEGIAIDVKPVVRPENPLLPEKLVTAVRFPERIAAADRATILDAIGHCAVKEVVRVGSGIAFAIVEAT